MSTPTVRAICTCSHDSEAHEPRFNAMGVQVSGGECGAWHHYRLCAVQNGGTDCDCAHVECRCRAFVYDHPEEIGIHKCRGPVLERCPECREKAEAWMAKQSPLNHVGRAGQRFAAIRERNK